MNRLYQKLVQVFITSALAMGFVSITNAQICNYQFELSSFSAGIYQQNHLELSFPEAIVMPLSEIEMPLAVQEDYELVLWLKGIEYTGGGLNISLSGASQVLKLIDNEELKGGIYKVPFPYDPNYSHLQIHWADACTGGKLQLMFIGLQRKDCPVFNLRNVTTHPSLWLNPNGPFGPEGSLGIPTDGQETAKWRSLSRDVIIAEQTDQLQQPTYAQNPDYLNGQPYLQFDGFNDMMSIDWGSALPQSGFSQFVVFRTKNEYGTLIAQADTPLYNANIHQSETGFRYGHMIHRLNLNGQNTYAQSYFKVDDEKFHIGLVHVPDSSFRSVWLDGQYVGANPTNSHTDFLSHLLIGGQANYGYFDGDIAEIILFDRTLNPTEIDYIHTYLSLKYQIPLESTVYRFPNGDTTIYEPGFVNKVGSIGVNSGQFLHRTEGFSWYREAKMTVQSDKLPDKSQILWADNGQELSLSADIFPRRNNRLAKIWHFWQTADLADEVVLELDGFPLGLQTMIVHPSKASLPVDELIEVYLLENLGEGKYRVRFNPSEHNYLSFSSEVSPLMDVQWSGFDGLVDAPIVELSWATLRERYTEAFVLERSFDGLIYQPIGKIDAAFNSDVERRYTFQDRDIAQLNSSLIHYRLKVVDPNGGFIYSPRLELRLPNFRDLYFDMSVLPGRNLKLNYFHRQASVLQGRLINQNGQLLESFSLGNGPAQQEILLDLSHLPAGIYSIELYDENLREIKRFLLSAD